MLMILPLGSEFPIFHVMCDDKNVLEFRKLWYIGAYLHMYKYLLAALMCANREVLLSTLYQITVISEEAGVMKFTYFM